MGGSAEPPPPRPIDTHAHTTSTTRQAPPLTCAPLSRTISCVSSLGAAAAASAARRTGWRSERVISFCTSSVIVAEKSMVWRLVGVRRTTSRICAWAHGRVGGWVGRWGLGRGHTSIPAPSPHLLCLPPPPPSSPPRQTPSPAADPPRPAPGQPDPPAPQQRCCAGGRSGGPAQCEAGVVRRVGLCVGGVKGQGGATL